MRSLFEFTGYLIFCTLLIAFLVLMVVLLARARDYWRRRAQFFETQAYTLMRSRPMFRHDDPADYWKNE
jgi:hypothetical protein